MSTWCDTAKWSMDCTARASSSIRTRASSVVDTAWSSPAELKEACTPRRKALASTAVIARCGMRYGISLFSKKQGGAPAHPPAPAILRLLQELKHLSARAVTGVLVKLHAVLGGCSGDIQAKATVTVHQLEACSNLLWHPLLICASAKGPLLYSGSRCGRPIGIVERQAGVSVDDLVVAAVCWYQLPLLIELVNAALPLLHGRAIRGTPAGVVHTRSAVLVDHLIPGSGVNGACTSLPLADAHVIHSHPGRPWSSAIRSGTRPITPNRNVEEQEEVAVVELPCAAAAARCQSDKRMGVIVHEELHGLRKPVDAIDVE